MHNNANKQAHSLILTGQPIMSTAGMTQDDPIIDFTRPTFMIDDLTLKLTKQCQNFVGWEGMINK